MDEDELLAELEADEEELAASASAGDGGSLEVVLIGVLTISLIVGGSALAAGYGSAGFNRQRTVEGSFGGIKGSAPGRTGVYSTSPNRTQPTGGQGAAGAATGPVPTPGGPAVPRPGA